MRKTLTAIALAAGLSPVFPANSAGVTNSSADPVMLAQAPTAGMAKMGKKAKDNFKEAAEPGTGPEVRIYGRQHPMEILSSVPHYEDVRYKAALDALLPNSNPSVSKAVDNRMNQIVGLMSNTGINKPILLRGRLPGGDEYLHYYRDIPGQANGQTFTFKRHFISSQEEFQSLQKGSFFSRPQLSEHAVFKEPGMYLLNGFSAIKDGVNVQLQGVDPYAYMTKIDFKHGDDNVVQRNAKGEAIVTNLKDPEFKEFLYNNFDPRWAGLSLDPTFASQQGMTGGVEMNFVAANPGMQQQGPGQQQQGPRPTYDYKF